MDTEGLIDQVQTLWPYIDFVQRYDWVKRLEPILGTDFVDTIKILTGELIWHDSPAMAYGYGMETENVE